MSPDDWFWSKVDKRGADECWPWLGSKTNSGYGRAKVSGTTKRAHRLAFPNCRLSAADKLDIVANRLLCRVTLRELSERYGVSIQSIWRISRCAQ